MGERNSILLTLEELAEAVECRFDGDGTLILDGILPLESAGPRQVSFFTNPRYRKLLETTAAGVVIVPAEMDLPGRNLLRSEQPYLTFARVVEIFHSPPEQLMTGVSPLAFVDQSSRYGQRVSVHPFASVGPGCRLGEGVVVHSGAVLIKDVQVGSDSVIQPNVTIYPGTVIGERVVVHAGSVLGSDGFGYVPEGGRHRKIPQVGRVVVEDDVEIGAGVTIDRAALGETRIGCGTKIDNLVQIGHNVTIGEDSILVAQVGISGSTSIGNRVTIAGQSGVAGHISIGDGCIITARSGVTKSVKDAGIHSGFPLMPHNRWRRVHAAYLKLPEVLERLRYLERTGKTAGSKGTPDTGESDAP